MKKYNKKILHFNCILYVILTIVELIKYLLLSRNLFGLIYLILTCLIMLLLIPTSINYKEKVSAARISKLIIIIVLGIFNSFILEYVVINNLKYVDSSALYLDSIFVIKNMLKPIIYTLITYVILIDCGVIKKIKK